ncbi:MAG: hypothetical protein A3C15_04295 [Candidatus Magasanikbacteria bacterium RIFCSPHIGHO2_02_FULL_50_9b]|uniref:O-antigen ligase-related domain-containing protein n=1 Tax=Candidatus Magasanikbacteria bacterium RIFCSPHIGHO2_02_FULL_50_9b TaxID=1798682 RepID=A0A1F6M7W6_9BACT|nr:MAG: hypothetical protein A3C15_04295 [Candidatus Magasanikbacteria bacterium RIFCSPHIGHO2_02_FULL_50_9b]
MIERILLVAFLVSPLILWTALPYPHTFPRFVWLALISTLWIGYIAYRRRSITLNKIDGVFLLFVAALGLSTIFSTDSTYSLWGSMERSFGFSLWIFLLGAYCGLRHAWHDAHLSRLVWCTTAAVVLLMSLWGCAQALVPGFATTFYGTRIGGTLGNAIFFGMYLSLSIGWLLLSMVAQDALRSRTEKFVVAVIMLLAITSMLLTKSTGALLGLCVGVGVGLTLWLYLKTKRTIILIIVAAIFVCAAGAGWYAYSKGLFNVSTTATRFIHWRMSLATLRAHPIFGYGYERYGAAANDFFDSALTVQALSETSADKPHNTQLELTVTTGVIGIGAYLALMITIIGSLWTLYKKSLLSSGEFAVLCGIIIGREVQNAAAFETHGTILFFILLLSYCAFRADALSHSPRVVLGKKSVAMLTFISFFLLLVGALRPLSDAIAVTRLDQTTTAPRPQQSVDQLLNHLTKSPYPETFFEALSHTIVGRYWQRPDHVRTWTATERAQWNHEAEKFRALMDAVEKKYEGNGLWSLRLGKSAFQLFSISHEPADAARAIRFLTQSAASSPRRQEPIMLIGQIELQRNNATEALAYFDAAVALNDKLGLAHWYRGMAQIAANERADVWWKSLKTGMENGYNPRSKPLNDFIYDRLLKAGLPDAAADFEGIILKWRIEYNV